jgi:hypothetical protein
LSSVQRFCENFAQKDCGSANSLRNINELGSVTSQLKGLARLAAEFARVYEEAEAQNSAPSDGKRAEDIYFDLKSQSMFLKFLVGDKSRNDPPASADRNEIFK